MLKYEYRTGEIRAALRKHGTIYGAARALGMSHTALAAVCHEHDIPAHQKRPWYLCPQFLKLPPIDGRNQLPRMLSPQMRFLRRQGAPKKCRQCGDETKPKRTFCERCVAERRRHSWSQEQRRMRAAKKSAVTAMRSSEGFPPESHRTNKATS